MEILKDDWQVTTIPSLAAHHGVGQYKIISWIRAGDLSAMNVAQTTASRPCWRIERAAWDRFKASRASTPPPPSPKRRRARTTKQYV